VHQAVRAPHAVGCVARLAPPATHRQEGVLQSLGDLKPPGTTRVAPGTSDDTTRPPDEGQNATDPGCGRLGTCPDRAPPPRSSRPRTDGSCPTWSHPVWRSCCAASTPRCGPARSACTSRTRATGCGRRCTRAAGRPVGCTRPRPRRSSARAWGSPTSSLARPRGPTSWAMGSSGPAWPRWSSSPHGGARVRRLPGTRRLAVRHRAARGPGRPAGPAARPRGGVAGAHPQRAQRLLAAPPPGRGVRRAARRRQLIRRTSASPADAGRRT